MSAFTREDGIGCSGIPPVAGVCTLLIGAHESISGGFWKSVVRAVEDGCEVIQIFSGSPSRWEVPEIQSGEAALFRKELRKAGMRTVLVHGSYLINPASPDPDQWSRSLTAMIREYGRCRAVGADFLVVHPGSHRGQGAAGGVERSAEMVRGVLTEWEDGPMILLENTAGSGSTLGGTFLELGRIRRASGFSDRVGYCFDTAHAFAAGYALSGDGGIRRVLDEVDREAGLDLVKAFHLNDSAREFGSRVDRHARIGEGLMGLDPFRELVADAGLAGLPGVLETQPLPVLHGRYRDQVDLLKGMRVKGRIRPR